MTPEELKEFREIAGLDTPSTIEQHKKWADNHLTNQPKVKDPLPMPSLEQFGLINNVQKYVKDTELENLANKLNLSLGNEFTSTIKIERL